LIRLNGHNSIPVIQQPLATSENGTFQLHQNLLVHCIIQTHFSDGKLRYYGTIRFTEPRKDSLVWRRCCQNSWV